MKCLDWLSFTPVLPRLLLSGFTFSQFFLVQSVLRYLDSDDDTSVTASHGYGLIGACVLVYTGIAISSSWYWREVYRSAAMVRGGLVIAIFEKVLRLREDSSIEAQANTLMASDVQRVVSGTKYLHEIWAGLLEAAIATYLLQQLMGLSSLAMLGLALACGSLSTLVAKKIGAHQQGWLQAMEIRIGATKNVLDSIKAVKMCGAESSLSDLIVQLRNAEIKAARPFRLLLTASVVLLIDKLAYGTLILYPLLVFAAYIRLSGGVNEHFNPVTMFSSLVLISLLGNPLVHLFQALPALGSARGCFARIQAFLGIGERSGIEQYGSSTVTGPVSAKEGEANRAPIEHDVVISLDNAKFGWSHAQSFLQDLSLQVKRAQFVAITGRVGSGKSFLLKSLVGETEKLSGSIVVPRGDIGYCSQVPWVENLSAEKAWSEYDTRGSEWLKRALARTISLGKPIVILDDVLSSLDRSTRQKISQRLLGRSGLLRETATTVIVTTHERSIAELADVVYNISDDATSQQNTRLGDEPVPDEIQPTQLTVMEGPFTLRLTYMYASQHDAIRSSYLMFRIVPSSAHALHSDLLRISLGAPFAIISCIYTGSLLNRFNQDLMLVDTFLPLDFFNTCAELFTAVFQMILIAMVTYPALSVLPVLFVVLYIVQRIYLRTSKQLRLLDLGWKAYLHTKFGETAGGLSTIRANGWVDPVRHKFMEKLDRSQEPFYLLFIAQQWLQLVLNLIVAGLATVVAGIAISLTGKITTGAVGVAFVNAATLGETLANFIVSWTSLETSLGAIARIWTFEKNTPQESAPPLQGQVSDNWPSSGRLSFDNVWATYDHSTPEPTWTLQGVSFSVQPGEHVALCGSTGSGKPSLLLSLRGMIPVPVGSITVDDADIAVLLMPRLRSRFHVVCQDTFSEPNSTFRHHLDPEGIFSDAELEEMLKKCRLWKKLCECGGLDSARADNTFSSGEAQLLALARIFLHISRDPKGVILLDEATSRSVSYISPFGTETDWHDKSLEADTSAHVEKLIATLLRGVTVVSVLHRLEAAAEYDKAVVLDHGRLVGFGRYKDVEESCALFKLTAHAG
ncbi:P-loop containing nucleoside triphosphate hydrolase protein [Emericellopsis atlantica]|uniref:P-loop containing nucleoside triphosphate hydrolase protein n=1 Tax=Emericellopsis atlantica TaxID=2614577 RepID=A0A9P8CLQ3_9HYPO|nr:P-loop containing nucleoside triphosphate hydrolase protein [Emericellopsis atlantica]KAG9251894.1 P-loop containing nucleoside triphosphate hydrolase protein [Emericellopsis atlantica]